MNGVVYGGVVHGGVDGGGGRAAASPRVAGREGGVKGVGREVEVKGGGEGGVDGGGGREVEELREVWKDGGGHAGVNGGVNAWMCCEWGSAGMQV